MKFHFSIAAIAIALFRFGSSQGFTLPTPFAADEQVSRGIAATSAAQVAQSKPATRPWTLRTPAEPPADNRNYTRPAVAAAFATVHEAPTPVTSQSSEAVWMLLRHHAALDRAREQKRETDNRAEMENRHFQKALQRRADERRQYEKNSQRTANEHRAYLAALDRAGAEHRARLAAIDRAGAEHRARLAAIDRAGAERRSQEASAAAASAERSARARADEAAANARRAAAQARRPY